MLCLSVKQLSVKFGVGVLITNLTSRIYGVLCKAAFLFCGEAKLNKSIQSNIMEMLSLLMVIPRPVRCSVLLKYMEMLSLLMVIPRKVNFTQMGRYGKRGEQCYRQTAERNID